MPPNARVISLLLVVVSGIATIGTGVNAAIKAKHKSDSIRDGLAEQPCRTLFFVPCTDVSVSASNILPPVIVSFGASFVIFATAIICLLLSSCVQRYRSSRRVPEIEALGFLLLSLLLLGSHIAFTVVFANDSAGVDVHVGELHVPDKVVDVLLDILNQSTKYSEYGFIKPLVITPYIEWLFALFAAIMIWTSRTREIEVSEAAMNKEARRQSLRLDDHGASMLRRF
ncbi:hypothetical protein CYLTODRAFT_455394 [Cylindrobasidium torrendii FP15055 ss-10]|uniref:Uncharacterized protein n=1 Tax=Cylindrobasidium torrendii FP15055 ss-10 TaxID=1314674 RepID=A0A0D7B843_9AGAR|nr:hypothetical protein CYLTODRAFT_455394 [Cylindrobasidium torrendii FP15055 ss-10]